MKLLFSLLMLLTATTAAMAQTTVSGTLNDTDGFPLPGATVAVEGTSTGTVADLDGNYTVTVPEGYTNLTVSYTGYETQTIAIDGRSTIDIIMSERCFARRDRRHRLHRNEQAPNYRGGIDLYPRKN